MIGPERTLAHLASHWFNWSRGSPSPCVYQHGGYHHLWSKTQIKYSLKNMHCTSQSSYKSLSMILYILYPHSSITNICSVGNVHGSWRCCSQRRSGGGLVVLLHYDHITIFANFCPFTLLSLYWLLKYFILPVITIILFKVTIFPLILILILISFSDILWCTRCRRDFHNYHLTPLNPPVFSHNSSLNYHCCSIW